MKGNQKFRNRNDKGVSAVIGVILMVAITVAIAATVYVYVSGMLGGQTQKAPNMAWNKESTPTKKITLVSADSGLTWDKFTVSYSATITACRLNGGATNIANGAVVAASGSVLAGAYINVTGTGSLSLTNTATNTLMGTWTWT